VRVARPTDFQRGDLKYWLADLPPGELANGPKNPLVWSRDRHDTGGPSLGDWNDAH